jgi:hypothetical protein
MHLVERRAMGSSIIIYVRSLGLPEFVPRLLRRSTFEVLLVRAKVLLDG